MIGSTVRRLVVLGMGSIATPLAFAQLPLQEPWQEEMAETLLMVGMPLLGMLFVLGIVAIALFHDRTKDRARLAAIERLVASGQPVPRELITGERLPLPLLEERRRDIRRGITLLCWAIAVALIPILAAPPGPGNSWRYGVWGLLFLLPSLGSFFKAWLTGREIARGASSGSPQP